MFIWLSLFFPFDALAPAYKVVRLNLKNVNLLA